MKAAATTLAFDNGGAFIPDTRREVEQYLSRGRTRVKGADFVDERVRLSGPRSRQQPQMGIHDAQGVPADHDVRHQGTARLEPRQDKLVHLLNKGIPHQQQVAVPAMRLPSTLQRNRDKPQIPAQALQVQQALARPETGIRLLQGKNIRTDLGDHGSGTPQIAAPV